MTLPTRKFLPQTLFGRAFLLLSLLILASGITWFTLFNLAGHEPVALRFAQFTASIVNLTRAALIASDPDKRLTMLRDIADSEGFRLYPKEEGDAITPLPDTYLFGVMKRAIMEQLGPRTRFASVVNGQPGVWISFLIDVERDEADESVNDEYWLMLPDARARAFVPWRWIGWGIASLVLALILIGLSVSRITRPLRALAAAAEILGQGHYPDPVPETGVSELRQVAEAFNRMSDDLKRNAAERALVLAGLSHDLRTPLARLRLESELSIDESAREAVIADIEQMDSIIGQFLDYARDEGDEALTETDINALVEQRAARYTRLSSLRLGLCDAPLQMRARPAALARALDNLLDNACKYGGEPFTLTTRREHDEIVIALMDSGPGIPEAEIDRLKHPFTRLENARTDASGTGLGLAIVERVARMHDGRLELSNRPEGGLMACLRLPFSTAKSGKD